MESKTNQKPARPISLFGVMFQDDVLVFRIISFLAIFAFPAFKLFLPEGRQDPWELRIILSTLCFVFFISTYVSNWIRKKIHLVSFVLNLGIVSWNGFLVLINQLDPVSVSLYLVVLTSCFFLLNNFIQLGLFSFWASLTLIFTPLVVTQPGVPPLFFYASTGFVLITGLIAQGFRLKIFAQSQRNGTLLQLVFDGSPDALFLVDPVSKKIDGFNQTSQRLFELQNHESLAGMDIRHLLQGIFEGEKYGKLRRFVKNEGDYLVEIPVFSFRGRPFWAQIVVRSIQFAEGKKWVVRVVDISYLKDAEEQLRISSKILSGIDSLVVVASINGDITYISPSVQRILGFRPEDCLGDGWWQLSRKNEAERFAAREVVRKIASGQIPPETDPYEQIIFDFWGNRHYIHWKDSIGENGTVIGVGQDYSKSRKSQLVKDAIFNISEAAISTHDPDVLFPLIHQEVIKVIECENFYLALSNPVTGDVSFPYFYDQLSPLSGNTPVAIPKRKGVGGMTEYALTLGVPLLLTRPQIVQLSQDDLLRVIGAIPAIWMAAPLIENQDIIGLMVIQDYNDERAFSKEDLDLLVFISKQVAHVYSKLKREEALRDSELKFRTISESALEGIVFHKAGFIKEANPAFFRVFGYQDQEDFGNGNLGSLIVDSQRAAFIQSIHSESRVPRVFEGVKKDGTGVFVEVLSILMTLAGEEIAIAAFRDISERLRAEAAEEASKLDAKFRAFIQNSTEIICICSENGALTYISPAFERVLGYRPDAFLGVKFTQIAVPEDYRLIDHAFSQTFVPDSGPNLVHFRAIHSEGETKHLEAALSNHIQDNQIKGVLISIRDVTDRILSEQKHHESEIRFRTLFNNSPDPIFVGDAHGTLLDLNVEACRLQGSSRDLLIGEKITAFCSEQSRWALENAIPLMTRGEINYLESEFIGPNQRTIAVEIRTSVVTFKKQTALIFQVRDITSRKESENQMIRSQNQLRLQNARLLEITGSKSLYSGELDLAFEEIVRVSAETLGVQRVGVWLWNETRTGLVCKLLWDQKENRLSSGGLIPSETHPKYFAALTFERVLVAERAREDDRTREFLDSYLIPLNIYSLLDAPIRFGGELVGVLCHESVGVEKLWTPEETSFAGSMADFASLAIEAELKKTAEDRLKDSLTLLNSTFESTRDGILVVDRGGNFLTCNQIFLSTWGIESAFSNSTILGMVEEKILTLAKDALSIIPFIRSTTTNDASNSFNIIELKDGRTLEMYVKPMLAGQEIMGRIWFVHDLSDVKHAELELKETEVRFRQIFNDASDAILVLDDGAIVEANQMALQLLGAERAALIHTPILAYCPGIQPNGRYSKDIWDEWLATVQDGIPQSFTICLQRLDGSLFDAEINLGKVVIKDRSFIQVFFRDISLRLQAEKALRESEKTNKALVNAIPDIMVRIWDDGTILDYRAAESTTLLLPIEQVMGKNIRELTNPGIHRLFMKSVREALENGSAKPFEFSTPVDLGERDFEARIFRYDDNQVLCLVREISIRKKAERELIQRNFELDSFVYRASHDLKAPLNSLMGLIQLLGSESKETAVENYLGLMNRSVVKLDTFIRDLTDFSRNTRLSVETVQVDFQSLLDECLENLRFMENADRASIRVSINQPIPFYSDPLRLGIILNNLISNAIKYQNLQASESWVSVDIQSGSGEAIIAIEDNGIGIASDHKEKVFQLFYRATIQSYGSGLGLYIVKTAVEKLGGRITLESEPRKGTRFVVKVPNKFPSALN